MRYVLGLYYSTQPVILLIEYASIVRRWTDVAICYDQRAAEAENYRAIIEKRSTRMPSTTSVEFELHCGGTNLILGMVVHQ